MTTYLQSFSKEPEELNTGAVTLAVALAQNRVRGYYIRQRLKNAGTIFTTLLKQITKPHIIVISREKIIKVLVFFISVPQGPDILKRIMNE